MFINFKKRKNVYIWVFKSTIYNNFYSTYVHGRMGLILFGGGAQYSLPEQANWTLIFLPKIVGERGGVTKKFQFPDILNTFVRTYENFAGHIRKFSLKSRNFREDRKFFQDISKFFRNFYVLPEFRIDFCPTVKIWGGAGTCPLCPYAYAYVLYEHTKTACVIIWQFTTCNAVQNG
jgi:hypothetical protein